jgi:uncharacterized protein (TIGR02996 family)
MKPDPPVAPTLEEGFLRAMRDDPGDEAHALVLADWLDEQGDPRGELLRVHLALRKSPPASERWGLEGRLRTLLAQGVRPCVPLLVNSVGMRLALIPAGSFYMGSSETEANRDPDEGPQHAVTISRPFFLGVHPVTHREWHRVLGRPLPVQEELWDCPVEEVSWQEAVRFCGVLQKLPFEREARRLYRLPTEAEWEYACRADTQTAYHLGDILLPAQANFDARPPIGFFAREHFRGQSTPVESFPPNAFGLFDMHGNVWEWCQDWYQISSYDTTSPVDPLGPAEGLGHVLRGGSWGDLAMHCRSAYRRNGGTLSRHNDNRTGFRVVCTIGRPQRRRKEGQP